MARGKRSEKVLSMTYLVLPLSLSYWVSSELSELATAKTHAALPQVIYVN